MWTSIYKCCIRCTWINHEETSDVDDNDQVTPVKIGDMTKDDQERDDNFSLKSPLLLHRYGNDIDMSSKDRVFYVYDDGSVSYTSEDGSCQSTQLNQRLPWWAKKHQRRWDRFGMTFFEPLMEEISSENTHQANI